MLRSVLPLVFLLALEPRGSDAQVSNQLVRGDDVTLSCRDVLAEQNQCQFTDWTLEKASQKKQLFIGGQRKDGDSSSSTLLQNCSLVLHRVKVEQSGAYVTCRQKSKIDVEFQLFVPSVFSKKESDTVTLTCSVNVKMCVHDVKWLNNGKEVTTDHSELQLSRSKTGCEVSVSFKDPSPPSPLYQTLKCQVKQRNSDQTVTLTPQAPPDDPTTTPPLPKSSTNSGTPARSVVTSHSTVTPSNERITSVSSTPQPSTLIETYLKVVVPVLVVMVVALVLAFVALILWRRRKGSGQSNENTVNADDSVNYATVRFKQKKNTDRTNPQSTDGEENVTYSSVNVSNQPHPSERGTRRKTGNPQNDVTYASVNFNDNKKKKKKNKEGSRAVEEDVTYSSVNVAAQPDPSLLYSSVHKPRT